MADRAMAHPKAEPKDAIEHATVIYPPNAARLFGSIGLMAVHS